MIRSNEKHGVVVVKAENVIFSLVDRCDESLRHVSPHSTAGDPILKKRIPSGGDGGDGLSRVRGTRAGNDNESAW